MDKNDSSDSPSFELKEAQDSIVVALHGSWQLAELKELAAKLKEKPIAVGKKVTLDGKQIKALDSSGAMLLIQIVIGPHGDPSLITLKQFQEKHLNVFELVREHIKSAPKEKDKQEPIKDNLVIKIGKMTLKTISLLVDAIAFVGEITYAIVENIIKPFRFRFKEFFVQLEQVFVKAIPVIILVTFMIGVVVAYISSEQIKKYGVSIFIVDGISLAMFRELSPIIVAIIVAGRSGSAFTAQIGTMKMNEEIDAIKTLGLSPLNVLVTPRLLALILSMPLLVFIGDVVGVFAGMLIADIQLNLTPTTFLDRLQTAVPIRWANLGFFKAPIFAACIGIIGCRNGLNCEKNARSVGLSTTSTVVMSIVTVIILDAIFAVIFQELEI